MLGITYIFAFSTTHLCVRYIQEYLGLKKHEGESPAQMFFMCFVFWLNSQKPVVAVLCSQSSWSTFFTGCSPKQKMQD